MDLLSQFLAQYRYHIMFCDVFYHLLKWSSSCSWCFLRRMDCVPGRLVVKGQCRTAPKANTELLPGSTSSPAKCNKWCTNTEWLYYHLQVCFRQSRSWFGIYPLTLKVFTKSSSTNALGKPISPSRKCIKQSSIPIFKLDRELDLRTNLMVESQISNAPQK